MQCPCHSQKPYAHCCKPYHDGELPPSPLALMRSRYSAYALCLADYIIATTHPDNPHFSLDKQQILEFSKNTQFKDLEILEATENTVTFRAHLIQNGHDASFTEKSAFAEQNGRWLYLKPLKII